jgi:putative protease
MVSEDCLPCFLHDKEAAKKLNIPHCHLGIRDSRKRIFPVEIDQECRTLIFNSTELCLIDYLPKLRKIGLDSLIIDARNKPADYIRNIFSIYHEALELTVAGDPKLSDKLDSLKERVRKISNGGITRGNFIRGTKEDN